jgi:hypothetical protein
VNLPRSPTGRIGKIKSARIPLANIKALGQCEAQKSGSSPLTAECHLAIGGETQMLRRMKDMEGYSISALDGFIGEVKDYYFDDATWVIRYLVVETGNWLASRKVLISPVAINGPNWSEKSIPAAITMEQVKNSPHIDTDKPVSRQHEVRHLEHYNFPRYWSGSGLWGAGGFPSAMLSNPAGAWSDEQCHHTEEVLETLRAGKTRHDAHLRSGNAIVRYQIQAADGDIGHVQAILIDERTWAIRYFIVNTSNWWLAHEVLIAPQWIEEINWATSKILVPFKRQSIKDAPPYDPNASLDRTQEARVYAHHRREGYWSGEAKDEAAIPHLGP